MLFDENSLPPAVYEEEVTTTECETEQIEAKVTSNAEKEYFSGSEYYNGAKFQNYSWSQTPSEVGE